jgi:beta-N-acetylhexosaminidase
VADGLLAGGVLPVVKHVPGHGRAGADSHLDLPVVDTAAAELETTDFVPFRALADLPAAMTAHVVFSAIDAGAPASVSRIVTQTIIREAIGFDGLLMSDDLSMRALSGSLRSRAEAVIRAGSDLALHCNGNLDEMREVVEGVPALEGKALVRLERARTALQASATLDIAEAEAALDLALATVA